MNILYLYHDYADRGKRDGEVMKSLGHNVRYYGIESKSKKGKIPITNLKGIDLVWSLSTFYNYYGAMDEDFISEIKKRQVLLVTYTTISTMHPLQEWARTFDIYDYVFLHNKEIAARLNNPKIGYMPSGYHPDQYYPVNKKLKYDISFMGSPQTNLPTEQDLRCQILKLVADKYPIRIYGKQFANRLKGVKVFPFKSHKEQRDVYNSTLINLDIPFINSPLDDYRKLLHLKNRFFEVPACKSFLLTMRFPEAEDILKDKVHCAYYDNPDDLLDKIAYYLKRPHEAQEIAERGYIEMKNKHTFRHRFERMFEIIEGGAIQGRRK